MTDEIAALIDTHPRIKAAEADLRNAEQTAEAALGDWHPNLSVTSGVGYENQSKGNGTADTSMPPRDLSVSIEQLLWDFGSTDAAVERARFAYIQARHNLTATRQALILEGVTAYLDVMRQNKLVQFARASVENIKRQAELEDSRVSRGSGFSTDVLQAKTQLAGADSRLTQAQGALKVANNRYRAVFGHDPGLVDEMSVPETPFVDLPVGVDEAVDIAFDENPGLDAAATDIDIARADLKQTKADEFYPRIDATATKTLEKDADGTVGENTETLFLVELTYDFSLGFTANNTLEAAKQARIASDNRYMDARDLIEEEVRNAWDNLETARVNAGHLNNQADIAAEFLELARKERSLGNRSLIDVLSGETALINASSDAASAETDVAIAVYSLLAAMGRLEL